MGTDTDVPMGHGVTASTIELGLMIGDSTNDAAVRSVGGTGGVSTEQKQIDALVSYLNDHGGIAGRKIVPIVYEYHVANATTASGREQEAQQACSAWTEDHQVAVLGITPRSLNTSIVECAAKADTPFVLGGPKQVPLADSAFSRYGRVYYAPSWMGSGRYYHGTLCNGLWDQGFFGRDARVAIMADDDPWVREGVKDLLKPCLNSHGVTVVSTVHYPDYLQSPWSSYAFQFQSANVTHVIWAAVGLTGLPVTQFMHAAESQGYRPLYGGSSDMHPSVDWNAPEAQRQNVRGVGVDPQVDVAQETPTSASGELCQEILTSAGLPPEAGLGNSYCQGLFFVKTVFDRATALTTSGFEASVANLGGAFDDPRAIDGATLFGPTRHDGAVLVRDFAYSAAKGQFVYTSPPRRMAS